MIFLTLFLGLGDEHRVRVVYLPLPLLSNLQPLERDQKYSHPFCHHHNFEQITIYSGTSSLDSLCGTLVCIYPVTHIPTCNPLTSSTKTVDHLSSFFHDSASVCVPVGSSWMVMNTEVIIIRQSSYPVVAVCIHFSSQKHVR